MDEGARNLPGKGAAAEEEDELVPVDSRRPEAIPWSWTKRATRRCCWCSWICSRSSQATAMHDGNLGRGSCSWRRKWRGREREREQMGEQRSNGGGVVLLISSSAARREGPRWSARGDHSNVEHGSVLEVSRRPGCRDEVMEQSRQRQVSWGRVLLRSSSQAQQGSTATVACGSAATGSQRKFAKRPLSSNLLSQTGPRQILLFPFFSKPEGFLEFN